MRETRSKTFAFTFVSAILVASPAMATDFATGSLIIPASATYQNDCGAVAMYGLVYDVLRANAYLEANRATFCPSHLASQTCSIEIYYAYDDTKDSPNRCTPTNRHAGPAYAAYAGTAPGYGANAAPAHNNTVWNDGCDFTVNDATVAPVMLVNNNSVAVGSDTTITTLSTLGKTTGVNRVFPRWGAIPIVNLPLGSQVNIVRYWGGSFIIDDLDAPLFLQLVSGTLPAPGVGGKANDSALGTGNWIDFAPFRANGANAFNYPVDSSVAACTFGTTVGGYVAIHRVKAAGYAAPTPRIFNEAPPRLALLARNANQTPANGGSSTVPGASSGTGRVDDDILQKYLKNGGLKFTGANGCPPGAYWSANLALCPTGGNPGQIYDTFDFQDLVNGKLNATWTSGPDIGQAIYKMLWAPHWEWKTTAQSGTGLPSGQESPVMTSIATFLNGATGLMAECASIETFEGANGGAGNRTQAVAAGKLQTCPLAGCATAPTTYGISKSVASVPTGSLYNCSDPTGAGLPLTVGGDCAYFAAPADPFAQIAEYLWNQDSGRVDHFIPVAGAGGSQYRPGLVSLVGAVTTFNKSLLPPPFGPGTAATARTMAIADFASRSNKDSDTAKGNLLYLAGHDMAGSVAGTKMVLLTLLQLGDPYVPPVMKEVSRSSAITSTIGGVVHLVQGTFESLTPPANVPSASSNGAAVTAFTFPDLNGHMRAVPLTAGVTSTAKTFAQLALTAGAFDGGTSGKIPATGTRTMFTNRATGYGAALDRRDFTDANIGTYVGAATESGADLDPANETALVAKLRGGATPILGGVDRSTPAVIEDSIVAGTGVRPKVVYYGAVDGMLHAMCAEVLGTCDVVGRELWAFVPRTSLTTLRANRARVQGSPRVIDLFGDFTSAGLGARSFRTILMFQTGWDDPTVTTDVSAVYALDITDPASPTIVWEYAMPAAVSSVKFGVGLTLSAGKVLFGGQNKLVVFAQTTNGGNGGSGSVVTAIDIETGLKLWQTSVGDSLYPTGSPTPVVAPRSAANYPVPAGGIPGGAVAVDRFETGLISDVVVGTLYGDIWQLDAATGLSRFPGVPLFRFSADKKPFGAPVTIYKLSGQFYAVAVSGGYTDHAASGLWSAGTQQAIAVSLGVTTLVGTPPLNESSASGDVPLKYDLGLNEKGFAQAIVIGGQLFITTDTEDVNSTTYGADATDSGKLLRMNLDGSGATFVTIAGGAGSVVTSGTTVYSSSADKAQAHTTVAATDPTGSDAITNSPPAAVKRKIWLRTL